MNKWNTATMHEYLQKAGVPGETYKYPIYCTIKNTSFFANAYNQHRGCFLALSDYRRLLFVECNALTSAPIRMGALGFDDIVSADVKRRFSDSINLFSFSLSTVKSRNLHFKRQKRCMHRILPNRSRILWGLWNTLKNTGIILNIKKCRVVTLHF